MEKYNQLSDDIIKRVGGKENVSGLTHCVTRLRFTLKDESKAMEEELKNMDGVVTVVKSAGQFQVVIGNHVPDVYKVVMEKLGLVENNDTRVEMSMKDRVFNFISGVMMPSMAIMTAAGIIQGLNAILIATGTLTSESSVYILLNAIGKGFFYFIPIVLGFNTAKVLKMNPYLGMIIGAILCMPEINGVDMEFFGLQMNVSYVETVLPVIIIVAIASPLEKFFNKVIPDVIKTFVAPALVLLIAVPLGYIVIGPAANYVSGLVSQMIHTLINLNPIIAGIVSGALWQVFVMFGVHIAVLVPSIMNLMQGTPDIFMSFIGPVSFSQTAVVFAIWLKTKDKKLKDIALPSWISGIFGVTEPAIYGITLPRIKYFIISCIGGAISGGIVGLLGVYTYQMAGMGVFSLPGNIQADGNMSGMFGMLIAIAVAMVFSFTTTYIMYKDDDVENEITDKDLGNTVPTTISKEVIKSPMEGEVIELNKVQDAAFSSGAIGKGVAIKPNVGEVVAPFDGTVMALFPTKHAIGLISDNGSEVLIHIGIDTVKLEGKHFYEQVKQGEKVKQGQVIMTFDKEAIENEGYILETPVIITNTNDYVDIINEGQNKVKKGDSLITVITK